MKSDPSPLRSLAISSCKFFKLKSLWIHKGFVILSIVQFSRYLFISCSLFMGDKRLIYYITSFEICQPLFWSFFKFLFDVMLSLLSGNFYIISYFLLFVKYFFSFPSSVSLLPKHWLWIPCVLYSTLSQKAYLLYHDFFLLSTGFQVFSVFNNFSFYFTNILPISKKVLHSQHLLN